MNNTLYDILEVSEKASKEVIEKAYKVLAKKYHPDLQMPENKAIAEAKMKKINEAYDVLSDDVKRKEYDETLASKRETEKMQQQEMQENLSKQYEQQNTYYQADMSQEEQRFRDMQRRKYEEELRKQQEQMQKQMQQSINEQYENAYYNYLRSLGYKIKERWTWEKTKKLLIIILILIIIGTILWILPPTHNMLMNFYENNKLIQIIVNIIGGIIIAFFETIGSIFSNLFSTK